jgi:transposase
MGHRRISEALRTEAVHLVVREGRSVPQVCKVLGVGATALRRWVARWRAEHEAPAEPPSGESEQQRRRIRDLESTVARLQEERDLLKKSIAFFIRDNDRASR